MMEQFGFCCASDLLQSELDDGGCLSAITTGFDSLDEILGGGLFPGTITELVGPAGSGKSQLCMQLSSRLPCPVERGGRDAEIVYVDTEGTFVPQRVTDMAAAVLDETTSTNDSATVAKKVLDSIYLFRCRDLVELTSTVHRLVTFCQDHPKVKMIIIDSLAFHLRQDCNLGVRRNDLLPIYVTIFQKLTAAKIAVILVNQVTTRFVESTGKGYLASALGSSWAHAATVRLWLYRDERAAFFWAELTKSPFVPNAKVPFKITTKGLRISKLDSDIFTGLDNDVDD